jgi:hypothetical protein
LRRGVVNGRWMDGYRQDSWDFVLVVVMVVKSQSEDGEKGRINGVGGLE